MILQSTSMPEVSHHVPVRNIPSWKRGLDFCGVVLVAPLLTPVFLIVAIYIKLVSGGPVLFVQSRVGYRGEYFRIYKFRTMHVPSVSRDDKHQGYVSSLSKGDGPAKKPDFQSDLILGGKLLRALAIDELPQLLNVFRGDMSLVGPRPDLLRLEDYEPGQIRRFDVLPGMTGLWQVSGKNRLSFQQMVELDIQYIETLSFVRDLRIMAKTLVVLVLERNE